MYAATSSVVVLAAEAEMPWLWWATLLPLTTLYAASVSLAFWRDVNSRKAAFVGGAVSGATALLAVVLAPRLALPISGYLAWVVLVGVTLAGLLRLALAATWETDRHWALKAKKITEPAQGRNRPARTRFLAPS